MSEPVTFANPYIACGECGRRVTWHSGVGLNEPCGHRADFNSVCPGWSPVNGCNCQKHLGKVEHGLPADSGA